MGAGDSSRQQYVPRHWQHQPCRDSAGAPMPRLLQLQCQVGFVRDPIPMLDSEIEPSWRGGSFSFCSWCRCNYGSQPASTHKFVLLDTRTVATVYPGREIFSCGKSHAASISLPFFLLTYCMYSSCRCTRCRTRCCSCGCSRRCTCRCTRRCTRRWCHTYCYAHGVTCGYARIRGCPRGRRRRSKRW
jgi:hypothetical protein